MKYKILWDYYSEGHKFHDGEYDTVGEAVKVAVNAHYSTPFLIVHVVEWTAITPPTQLLEGGDNN